MSQIWHLINNVNENQVYKIITKLISDCKLEKIIYLFWLRYRSFTIWKNVEKLMQDIFPYLYKNEEERGNKLSLLKDHI